MMKPKLALLLAFLLLPSIGFAQADEDSAQESTEPAIPLPPQPPPAESPAESNLLLKSMRLEFSGLMYAFWSYDLRTANPDGDTESRNRFDLSRAFLNFEPQMGKFISARITPDVFRINAPGTSADGSLGLRLFFAYVRFAEVAPGVAVVAGLQPNPLNAFDDSVWQYRVLGTSIHNVMTGAPTTDLGVGVNGKHFGGLLEYHLLLSNGEGGFGHEPNKFKTGTGRITLAPFAEGDGWSKGLRLTAMGNYGIQGLGRDVDGNESHLSRGQVMGFLSFEHQIGTLALGVGPTWDSGPSGGVETQDGLLVTTFGFVNLPLDLRLLARFDYYNPDLEEPDPRLPPTGSRTRVIGGLAYRLSDMVQFIANYQRLGFEMDDRTAPGQLGSTLNLHMEAKY